MYALAWALRQADRGISEEVTVTSFRSILEKDWNYRKVRVPVVLQAGAEPHNNEMQRTRPAQATEPRR
jgi:hypothetical protein